MRETEIERQAGRQTGSQTDKQADKEHSPPGQFPCDFNAGVEEKGSDSSAALAYPDFPCSSIAAKHSGPPPRRGSALSKG